MYRFISIATCTDRRILLRRFLLILFWFLGVFIGIWIAQQTITVTSSLVRSVVDSRSSIVGLLTVLTVPFLISAILFKLSLPTLGFCIVFIKSLLFSYCSCSLVLAFGEAGWLMRWLLLFSDSCTVVLLLWLWIRNITGQGKKIKSDLLFCCLITVLIGCVDYYILSPFAAMLLSN